MFIREIRGRKIQIEQHIMNKPQITKLEVAGFKSIRDAEIELSPLNVVIGANGAGKSNLLGVFDFLRSSLDGRVDGYVGRHGGPNSVLYGGAKTTEQIRLAATVQTEAGTGTLFQRAEYRPPDGLFLCAKHTDKSDKANRNDETVFDDLCSVVKVDGPGHPGGLIYDWLKNEPLRIHLDDTSLKSPIRMEGYIEDNATLRTDGGNLAAVLYAIRQRNPVTYHRIRATIGILIPRFDDFVLEPQRLNPKNILLNWRHQDSEHVFGPHQISDGSLRAIVLATVLLQARDDLPGLILLDEPELGLHPSAIAIMAGVIQSAAVNTQVIVSTQSTVLVDLFEPRDVIVAHSDRGASTFHRLDEESLKDWLEEYSIGELWQKNILGGGPY